MTSNLVIMFLENSIALHTRVPVFSEQNQNVPSEWLPAKQPKSANLIQWVTMKATIFEIYDHRIAHSEEIDGTINSSHMSFDEHLILFMLEKHKTRQTAEYALVDFLSSLKYYADTWQRAKTYAAMIGFLKEDQSYFVQDRGATSDNRLP